MPPLSLKSSDLILIHEATSLKKVAFALLTNGKAIKIHRKNNDTAVENFEEKSEEKITKKSKK